MSKTSVAGYVQDLISKGDAAEKDRSKLEEVLKDVTKKLDNDKIEDFFIGLDMEKVNNPDLFDSSKGLNLQEIAVVAQNVTNKIQINEVKERENRNRQEKVSDKELSDFISLNNQKEDLVNKIKESYPGLSAEEAEWLAGCMERANEDKARIDKMRESPENEGLSGSEFYGRYFDNEVDRAIYISTRAQEIDSDIRDNYDLYNLSQDQEQEILKMLIELEGLLDCISEDTFKKIGFEKDGYSKGVKMMIATINNMQKDGKDNNSSKIESGIEETNPQTNSSGIEQENSEVSPENIRETFATAAYLLTTETVITLENNRYKGTEYKYLREGEIDIAISTEKACVNEQTKRMTFGKKTSYTKANKGNPNYSLISPDFNPTISQQKIGYSEMQEEFFDLQALTEEKKKDKMLLYRHNEPSNLSKTDEKPVVPDDSGR